MLVDSFNAKHSTSVFLLEDLLKVGGGVTPPSYSKIQTDDFSVPVWNSGRNPLGYVKEANHPGNVVCIAGIGPVGNVTLLKTPFYRGGLCITLTVKDEALLDISYIYYWLANSQEKMKRYVAGSAQPYLDLKRFMRNTQVMLPPLSVQQKIAVFLDAYTSTLDSSVQLQEERVKLLKMEKALRLSRAYKNICDSPAWPKAKLMCEWESEGKLSLGRGKVISKDTMRANPGPYPVYSSSVTKGGLFGYYNDFAFNEELLSWSVDGGGDFFYRPKHRFSLTNVSGFLRLHTDEVSLPYLKLVIMMQHPEKGFGYLYKAHPSNVRREYRIPVISKNKQEILVDYFDKLDEQIRLEGERLELLKLQRQVLLAEVTAAFQQE